MTVPRTNVQPPPGHTPQFSLPATTFDDKDQFHDHALNSILNASHHREIVYTQVPPAWSADVLKRLDEETEHRSPRKNYNPATSTIWIRMSPTEIHDCHQSWVFHEMGLWLFTGLLTLDEFRYLSTRVGTTINFPSPGNPYTGAWKEPDLMIRTHNQRMPIFVFESCWPESLARLRDDMSLWLVGGKGIVIGTAILRWELIANTDQVSGVAEVYSMDANGIPTRSQELTIFPTPPAQEAEKQAITFTRGMLFGDAVAEGRNRDDVFDLNLNALREDARRALGFMGLVPA
ncbi:hypothetical protein FQN50_009545 [Emmonsiellopsis sp. PD_5]|nr:hypothetical protein FQN50_009545 [Emmonsiellopsis sp. PD_5]